MNEDNDNEVLLSVAQDESSLPYIDDNGFTDRVMKKVNFVRRKRLFVLHTSLFVAVSLMLFVISHSGFHLSLLNFRLQGWNDWLLTIGFWLTLGLSFFVLRSEKVVDL